jgi:hypothetical protein
MKCLGYALFIIIFPTIVHAWSEDILSHFQPYITIQEEYDSNINLSGTNKQGDFLTTISPGFRFSTTPRSPTTRELRQAPTAEDRYGVDLDFNAGFNFYAKNHEDNYISLNGLLNAWYAVTPKLNFRVRDYLIRSDDIREADYSPTAIPGQYLPSRTLNRVPWFRNVFEPSLQYQYGRESVLEFNYRNNIYQINSQLYQNSMENFFNPKITHWFDIRNGVSFEYGLTLGDFQRSPNLVGHMAMGRYTYRFNPNTSIFGQYTQLWRNFDAPGIDYTIYRPTIGIEHAFSSTLSGKAQLGYYWTDPQKGSTVGGYSYDILLTQKAKKTTYTISFEGGYTEDFFTTENRGFTQSNRAIGRISHQVLQKMNVGVFSSFDWIKYYRSATNISLIGGERQKDKIWTIGGNASYELFKWLTLSVEVDYTKNFSNINSADYSDYRGIFKVTATY